MSIRQTRPCEEFRIRPRANAFWQLEQYLVVQKSLSLADTMTIRIEKIATFIWMLEYLRVLWELILILMGRRYIFNSEFKNYKITDVFKQIKEIKWGTTYSFKCFTDKFLHKRLSKLLKTKHLGIYFTKVVKFFAYSIVDKRRISLKKFQSKNFQR